jgi:hypothetical protein
MQNSCAIALPSIPVLALAGERAKIANPYEENVRPAESKAAVPA